MPEPTPIPDVIATAASAPATESADGHTITERPLTELIEADKHAAGEKALRKPGRGLMFSKIRRGGALG